MSKVGLSINDQFNFFYMEHLLMKIADMLNVMASSDYTSLRPVGPVEDFFVS